MSDQLSNDLTSLRIDRSGFSDAPKTGRRWVVIAVIAALVVAVGVLAFGKLQSAVFRTEVTLTEVALVSPMSASTLVTATGYVQALSRTEIGVKIGVVGLQAERIGEVAVVIAIGALLWAVRWEHAAWWFVPLLLLVIRPLAVRLGLAGARVSRGQRWLIGWFGIRGVGSLYYLMYAVNHGVDPHLADQLVALTLSVVVTSIVVHGVSVTPMMAAYEKALRAPRTRS